MTIAIDNSGGKVLYTSNGVATNYVFSFKVLDINDIEIYEDGVLTVLAYTVNLNADQDASPGGSIDYDAGVPSNLVIILIKRVVDIEQQTDYTIYGGFPPETHELALDNLTQIVQQLEENVDRSLLAKIDDDGTTDFTLPSYTARRALVWDLTLKKLVNSTSDPDDQSGAAEASAVAAEASAVAADNSFILANNEANLAQASRVATDALYTSFFDAYLGPFATDPTLDNSGNALGAGDLYYNTAVPEMRVYTGSVWIVAYNASLGINDSGTANAFTIDPANNISVTNNIAVNKQLFVSGTSNVLALGDEPPTTGGTGAAYTLTIPDYSGSGVRTYSFICHATNPAINPTMNINGTGALFLTYLRPQFGAIDTLKPFQLKPNITYRMMNNGGANYVILNTTEVKQYSNVFFSTATGLIGLGNYTVPFDSVVNPSAIDFYNQTFFRWEPPVRGLWLVESSIQMTGCVTGDITTIRIVKNGSIVKEVVNYAGGATHTLHIKAELTVGSFTDQFQISVQNATTSVTLTNNNIRSWATMRMIHEE